MPSLSDFKPGDYTVETPGTPKPVTGVGSVRQLGDLKPGDYTVEQASEPSLGGKILSGTSKALGYAGGIMRTGLGSVASVAQNAVQGNVGDVITKDDVMNALKGNAPSGAEILKRMGVSSGPSTPPIPVPFTDKTLPPISLRDAEGFGVDVATDPIAEVAKMIKAVPYIGKVINASDEASSALGKAIYKSAFSPKAQGAADTMLEGIPGKVAAQMPVGTNKQLAQKILDTSDVMSDVRKGLYQQADAVGAKIAPEDMDFSRAEGIISDMEKTRNSTLQGIAKDGRKMIEDMKNPGPMSLAEASAEKTNLNSNLPSSFFSGAKPLPAGKRISAALAADLKDMIVTQGNKAADGLGDAIDHVNTKWAPLIEATSDSVKTLDKPATSRLSTIGNSVVLGLAGPAGLAKKAAFDAVTSAPVKTGVGAALMRAGENGIPTTVNSQLLQRTQGQQ